LAEPLGELGGGGWPVLTEHSEQPYP
jgi:hypothetical protein